MKNFLLFLVMHFMLLAHPAMTQTFDEFFRQKRTQHKYLLEQILALQTYGRALHQGYDIAKNGLTWIENFKQASFSQHNDNFALRRRVNPHLASLPNASEILMLHLNIQRILPAIAEVHEELNLEERQFLTLASKGMRKTSGDIIGLFLQLLENDEFSMTDSNRLEAIRDIHLDLAGVYATACTLYNQKQHLVKSRLHERWQIAAQNPLYQ